MSSPPSSQTPIHVEYRNGTYYGQLSSDYKRNGRGMLVLDTSTVLFAEWRQNQIQGQYVYIGQGIRAYGTMVNGKLDGFNVIATVNSYTANAQSNQYTQPNTIKTFYGQFRSQKIYGRCIQVERQTIQVCQYSNNEIEQITVKKPLRQRQLYDLLKQTFPHNLYTLDEHLTAFIKTYISELQNLQEIARYEPCINYFSNDSDEKFFGFQECAKPTKKFGIVIIDNQVISVGQHNNSVLQGIGRLYGKERILDGAFRNGKIAGIGVDYNIATNKFLLQVHDGSEDRVDKGFGFPLREIIEFRKEFHLRSIYFYNDIAVLNLKGKLEDLIAHMFASSKRPTAQTRDPRDFRDANRTSSRSNSKRIQNSPLREKLSRYEMESDIIEDNSPLKNRPNEYRPVDRASSYFREEPSNNQYRNQGRFSRNRINTESPYEENVRFAQTSNSAFSRKSQERQTTHSRSKFQQRQSRQRQTYNEILRQNAPYQQTRERGYSNYQQNNRRNEEENMQNRERRHTRDLVKQLQTQEKQRRLALDQIYSKSNLYGRNKR